MDSDALTIFYHARSMIERDALLHRLSEAGIRAKTSPRDISRKYTETMVDLSYGEYSALFDGFPVLIPQYQLQAAKEVLRNFLSEVNREERQTGESQAAQGWRPFYMCAFGSIMFPVIMHVAGIFNLWRALQSGQRPYPLYFVFAIVLYLFGAAFTFPMWRELKDWLGW